MADENPKEYEFEHYSPLRNSKESDDNMNNNDADNNKNKKENNDADNNKNKKENNDNNKNNNENNDDNMNDNSPYYDSMMRIYTLPESASFPRYIDDYYPPLLDFILSYDDNKYNNNNDDDDNNNVVEKCYSDLDNCLEGVMKELGISLYNESLETTGKCIAKSSEVTKNSNNCDDKRKYTTIAPGMFRLE
ncbi:hypothetical protein LIER_12291 [Lithospermum erythrorhizon]|uniref:Uncharacterized protein n=1 Tax=Lithospermum erythrorhizon TaxID=34254 RepID=A0AAV3PWD8_LITER